MEEREENTATWMRKGKWGGRFKWRGVWEGRVEGKDEAITKDKNIWKKHMETYYLIA